MSKALSDLVAHRATNPRNDWIKDMNSIILAAVAALALAGTANAAVTNITGTAQGDSFTSFAGDGAGTHGLETRGGRAGARDWELGLGTGTSQPGKFVQAEWDWDDEFLDVMQWAFEYDYNGGTSEFRIWDAASSRPGAATLSFGGLSQGNAIEVFAKRNAQIRITELDGHVVDFGFGDISNAGSESAILYSEDFLDGFKMAGTLDILSGRGSAYEVFLKAGTVDAPVPIPAALPLLAAGLGGLALMRRRG